MLSKNDSGDRRKAAISACLDQFCNKGLYETTSRDLSKALKLQSGGMYSYFSNMDEAVLVCAEEAAFLLEKYLIEQAMKDIGNIDLMFDGLLDRADKLSHMMKFFVQVCTVPKYRDGMEPVLNRLTQRYKSYAQQVAQLLDCPVGDIEPFFYMCISAISNYMVFHDKECLIPQILLAKQEIKKCLSGGRATNEP